MSKQANIMGHWKKLLAVLLAGIAGAAAFLLLGAAQSKQQVAHVFAADMAAFQAIAVDNGFQSMARQVEGLALQSSLRSALNTRDAAALEVLEREWSTMFPQVERMLLLPLDALGVAGLSPKHKSQLKKNIEKDLVSEAFSADSVSVDTYKLDERYVVSFAKSVTFGGQRVGVILLTLKGEWLGTQLESLRDAKGVSVAGYTSVMYGLPNSQLSVVTSNRGASGADAVSEAETQVASNPNIKVRFSLTSLPDILSFSTIVAVVALVAVALIGMLAIIVTHKGMLEKVNRDVSELKRFLMDSFDGHHVDKPSFSVLSVEDLIVAFRQSLATIRENASHQLGASIEAEPARVKAKGDWQNPNIANLDVSDGVAAAEVIESSTMAPPHIFRAYDIRGVADEELTDDVVMAIGKAIGSAALADNSKAFVVGRDGRLSSERIQQALIEGLLATGVDVVDIGLVPTPVMYFAVETLGVQSGLIVTGSHNGPKYNGIKVVINGAALCDEAITALYRRIERMEFEEGRGDLSRHDVVDAYMDHIASDVVFAAPMKVVLDCGNGAASDIAPMLYASLGCEVIPLFAEVDGAFPNHLPDPGKPENLTALIAEVSSQGADIGLAFDGDADRVVAVTADGRIVDADQLLMLFAKDVLTRNPGSDVVFDVKSTRKLGAVIAESGGRPVMWQSGHSRIKRKMREVGALLGGEFSGHFFFKERWFGFDDGMYAGARLIEHLTLEGVSLADALSQLPSAVTSPEIDIEVAESKKFDIVKALELADFGNGEKSTLDGLRVDFPWGWGLVRPSNTSAKLTARFEADTEENLAKIKSQFSNALSLIDGSLAF